MDAEGVSSRRQNPPKRCAGADTRLRQFGVASENGRHFGLLGSVQMSETGWERGPFAEKRHMARSLLKKSRSESRSRGLTHPAPDGPGQPTPGNTSKPPRACLLPAGLFLLGGSPKPNVERRVVKVEHSRTVQPPALGEPFMLSITSRSPSFGYKCHRDFPPWEGGGDGHEEEHPEQREGGLGVEHAAGTPAAVRPAFDGGHVPDGHVGEGRE